MNIERAKRLRQEGYSWAAVARRMKTTIFKLRRAWAASGEPPDTEYRTKKRKPAPTAEQVQAAFEMRSTGLRWKAIAESIGVSLDSLESAVFPPKRPPSAQVAEAYRLRQLGNRWKDIARMAGRDVVSIQNEVRWYSRFGLIAKPPAPTDTGTQATRCCSPS